MQVEQRHSPKIISPVRGGALAYIRGARFVSPDYVLASADYPVRPSETVILEFIALAPNISNSTTVSAQATYISESLMQIELPAFVEGTHEFRLVLHVSGQFARLCSPRLTRLRPLARRMRSGLIRLSSHRSLRFLWIPPDMCTTTRHLERISCFQVPALSKVARACRSTAAGSSTRRPSKFDSDRAPCW